MPVQAGQILLSLSSAADDYFYGALVYLVEYNQEGALGFLFNRLFPRLLNELVEFAHLPSFPLYEGGPIDEAHLYFIHRRPDVITEGNEVANGIYYGGNFAQVISGIEKKTITPADVRIFIGYCGWHRGDLEEEISKNEWELKEGNLFQEPYK